MPKQKKVKTIEEKFQKMTQKEHIKKRSDTYIGNTKTQKAELWLLNNSKTAMIHKNVKYVPGMYKIIDEIITNAGDRITEDKTCDTIKIDYTLDDSKTNLEISVYNNGLGIPIAVHQKYNLQVVTLLFGRLLSSSNYDDNEDRKAGGRNGYGAKLTNIFSKKFTVETVDAKAKKKLVQTWENNMDIENEPKITNLTAKKIKSYTKITFTIDIEKFNIKKISNDMVKLIDKRTYDLAATVGINSKVYLNNEKINFTNFKNYIQLFIDKESKMVYDQFSNDWQVGVVYKPDQGYKQVSYVNGICTFNGGNHVKYIEDYIIKELVKVMKKKSKDVKIKANHLKEHLFFFVNCMVINPSFTSQTKEELKSVPEEFGTECTFTAAFIKRILKTGIVDQVLKYVQIKESAFLKKTDGKKTLSVRGITKLTDAIDAGTKKSQDTILILTEGDSAKGLAMAGREKVGNRKIGVFPLKGKLLNVRDAAPKKLAENEEIKNIKKILGLKQGHEYKSLSELRYGRLMIFSDQDLDGFHIKGLVINFIAYYWPSLVDLGFITFLPTHIVRVTKGKQVKDFMTLNDFETWKQQNLKGWYTKYYKGLGTSTRKDAKEYFTDLEKKLITYIWKDELLSEDSDSEYIEVYSSPQKDPDENLKEKCSEALSLAFEKKLSNKRKEWLSTYDPSDIIRYNSNKINLHDFVHKELKQFSIDDNQRSIPSKNDGLKPSLRKILFGCFKKKCNDRKSEIKVSQLSGYISEHSAYHHGEASLQGAIVGLAQDIVGKNNVNLLYPNGQFGCLDPETEVFLWNSKIVKAKDIKVGDQLIGDNGLPRTVSKTIKGNDTMYKIKNGRMNDYIVNSNHILTCYLSGHKSIYWKNSTKTWNMIYYDKKNHKFGSKSFSTTEKESNHFNKSKLSKNEAYLKIKEFSDTIQDDPIFDINLQDYLKLSKHIKDHIKGVLNSKVIKWDEQKIRVDPYILGSWLGDGMSDCHAISSIDSEIIKSWAIWLDKIGCELVHCENYNDHESCTYYIRRRGSGKDKSVYPIGSKLNSSNNCKGCKTSKYNTGACDWTFDKNDENFECNGTNINNNIAVNLNPFKELMKNGNLFDNKHIPVEYIFNSEKNRLELLAGIIDTDGSIKKQNNTYGYRIHQSEKRKHIIESFRIIAGSLGYRAKVTKNKNMLELTITGYNLEKIPVKVERKKIKTNCLVNNPMIHKIEIEKIENGEFCGWHIDSNERFLLGDFTITHNTRLEGGKDSASPRYIFTFLSSITRYIFKEEDEPVLKYLEDDGRSIEPEFYYPIVPTVLINGGEGIGTGWSSDIPKYNILDIVDNIKNLIDGNKLKKMKPWYRNFKGQVKRFDENTYCTYGCAKKISDTQIEITELPIGKWTQKYKEFLDSIIDIKDNKTKIIRSYENLSSDSKVHFILNLTEAKMNSIDNDKIHEKLKLISKIKTSNMHLINDHGVVQKYEKASDIIKSFYKSRLNVYIKRKNYWCEKYKNDLSILKYRRRYIQYNIDKKIKVFGRKKDDIISRIEKLKFPKLAHNYPSLEQDRNYDYIIKLYYFDFTKEKISDLDNLIDKKMKQLTDLLNTSEEDMWKQELDELVVKYHEWIKENEPVETEVKVKTKAKRRKKKSAKC